MLTRTNKIITHVAQFQFENDETAYSVTLKKEYEANYEKQVFRADQADEFTSFLEDSIDERSSGTNIIEIAYKAHKFFAKPRFRMTMSIGRQIENYINSYSDCIEFWQKFISKKDFIMSLFEKRRFPYLSIESKEWTAANRHNNPIAAYEMRNGKNFLIPSKKVDEADNVDVDIETNQNDFKPMHPHEYSASGVFAREITQLVEMKLNEQAAQLFKFLMLSPSHFHIVRKSELWQLFSGQPAIMAELSYIFYYSMYLMRQEEWLLYNNVDLRHRALFTFAEAYALPNSKKFRIEFSPYMQTLPIDVPIQRAIPFYLQGFRSICSPEMFARRFALATCNAFQGLNLADYRAAVTGSIMIPCAHINPLEELFAARPLITHANALVQGTHANALVQGTHAAYMTGAPNEIFDDKDLKFLNYLEYYYPGYLSLMPEELEIEFAASVTEERPAAAIIQYENEEDKIVKKSFILKQNIRNITKSLQGLNASDVFDDELDNSASKFKPAMRPQFNALSDMDVSITATTMEEFTILAERLFERIRDNCRVRGEVRMKRIDTLSQYKYKIYGPGLSRPIDLFRIDYGPEIMVKRFHLNCVKMFYQAPDKIYMWRSCIAALLSGVNEYYSWFSCNKIPADIILKYAMRGISTVLNTHERNALTKYVRAESRWSVYFEQISANSQDMFGGITTNHTYFQPHLYNAGLRMGLRNLFAANMIITPGRSATTPADGRGGEKIKSNSRLFMFDMSGSLPAY